MAELVAKAVDETMAKFAKAAEEAKKNREAAGQSYLQEKAIEKKHMAAARLSLQKYYDTLFEEFLQLPGYMRSWIVRDASWGLQTRAMRNEITKDEYLAEKRILQTLCAFVPPVNVDSSTFKKEVLPYMDGAGYIQLYRGICEEELAELRAGNIDALGIWWTTIIDTAVDFSGFYNRRRHGARGFVISWRVWIGYLKHLPSGHPGEVHLSPRQVWDSGQCGKIKVLNRLQIALLRRVNKSQ